MAGFTLQELQAKGARPKVGGLTLEQLQPKPAEPVFGERIREDLAKRRETFQAGVEAESLGKQTPIETGVQLLGQGAGLVFDIGGELISSAIKLIPGFIKEPLKDVAEDVLNSPIGQAGLNAANAGIETYRAWKQGNPRAARNLESVTNLTLLFPATTAVKATGREVLATTGELAGKAATRLETQLGKQTLQETLDVIKPELTKIEKQAALEAGRGVVKAKILPRRFETITLKPTAREVQMANVLDGVVKKSANAIDNIAAIDRTIARTAINVEEGLRGNNTIFNKAQLKSVLAATKEESRVVFGADKALQNNYNAVIDEMLKQAGKETGNLTGLLQARKNFDRVIDTKFPKLLSNPLGDSVRQNAVRDVRRAVNSFIEEKLPKDNLFRAKLREQNLMYDAIKNIAKKTSSAVDTPAVKRVMAALRQNPLVAGVTGGILTYGALMGMFSNPLVIGTLLLGGSIKLGNVIFTSKMLKQMLINVFRAIESSGSIAGKSESLTALRTIIDKIEKGEISAGLSIKEIPKKKIDSDLVRDLQPLALEARKYREGTQKFGVRYGNEIKEKVIDFYKKGYSSKDIEVATGIHSSRVLSWVDEAGLKRTISESKILYGEDIPKVIELYKQGKNTTEISRELNLAPSSVARWVKEAGITRSNSEVQSILAELGKTNVLGVQSKVSTKFGTIPADSAYEAVRIKQLEADPNIIGIKRATRIPFGENKHYIPDIEIKYKDGSTVIEEIKPVYKLGDEKVVEKEKAARKFYKDKDIEYRVISENDIGVDTFRNINIDDFKFGSEEIKSRFLGAIKKAQFKTKSQLTDFYNQVKGIKE